MLLCIDDHTLEPITLDNRIGQEDTILMACYQFYNAELVEIPKEANGKSAEVYIDCRQCNTMNLH